MVQDEYIKIKNFPLYQNRKYKRNQVNKVAIIVINVKINVTNKAQTFIINKNVNKKRDISY